MVDENLQVSSSQGFVMKISDGYSNHFLSFDFTTIDRLPYSPLNMLQISAVIYVIFKYKNCQFL